jgi:hypothetical protein
MLSTVENGSNSSSDSSTAVYRMVLRYSVAIIGWLPVMNDSTRYRQLLLLLRNSKKMRIVNFWSKYLTLPQRKSTTAQYHAVMLCSQQYLYAALLNRCRIYK